MSRRPGPSVRVRVVEYRRPDATPSSAGTPVTHREDRLATEEPLEIRLAWPGRPAHRLVVTMRTPGYDFELATGFLATEGLLADHGPPLSVAYCTDTALTPEQAYNVVTVTLDRPPAQEPPQRYQAMSAACGVCGKQSLDDVATIATTSPASPVSVADDVIAALPDRLRAAQRVFDRTGGLHAAGLFTPDGDAVVVREDIGRHNAVDKVIGHQVLHGTALSSGAVLCVSGRVGFEIVAKAVAAGIGAVVAVGAPSSLAVDLARTHGVLVAGFVRDDRFVVYSGADRVVPRGDPAVDPPSDPTHEARDPEPATPPPATAVGSPPA